LGFQKNWDGGFGKTKPRRNSATRDDLRIRAATPDNDRQNVHAGNSLQNALRQLLAAPGPVFTAPISIPVPSEYLR